MIGMEFMDAITINQSGYGYNSARERGFMEEPALFSSPSTPDLFTAATAPDAAQKLGQVKVGTMNALKGNTPSEASAPEMVKPATQGQRSTQQSMFMGPETTKDGQMSLFSSPTPWPKSFPNVLQMSTANAVVKHPDHPAAKAGDPDAAAQLVMDLSKPEKIKALVARHPQAIVVPVHAEEASGRNKIPSKFADYIGHIAGLEVNEGIAQSNKVGRTGKGAWHRLAFRPQFAGAVISGREYILVDDIVTGGGSLSELRQYIEANGGKVVEMATLGAAQFSANIRLSEKSPLDLTEKYREEFPPVNSSPAKTSTPDQPLPSPSQKPGRSFALGRLTTQEIESLRQDSKASAQHSREYFQKHAPHLAHKS